MIRNYLLPKFYHSFIFAKLHSKHFKKIYVIIRKSIRKILYLRHHLPKAAFHTRVADGAIGIPSLRYLIPLIAKNSLVYKAPPPDLLKIDNKMISSINHINNYYKKELYRMCDGIGLRRSLKCSGTHQWVSDGTSFLSGKDYINCLHIRYGYLYNKNRCARGRNENDKYCRRGCQVPETLNHILQNCYSTHGGKIKKNDALVNYIMNLGEVRGRTVHKKP